MPPGARYRGAGERGPGDPGGLVCPPFDVRGRLAALERARRRGARRDRRRGDGAPRAAGRAGGGGEWLLDAPRAQGRPLPHALAPRAGGVARRGGGAGGYLAAYVSRTDLFVRVGDRSLYPGAWRSR